MIDGETRVVRLTALTDGPAQKVRSFTMRHNAMRVAIALFILAAVGSIGSAPARGSDLNGMPAVSPTTQPSASTPQGQGKTEDRREAMHQLNVACGDDMKKFCRHVQPGGGRLVQCLEHNQSEIPPNCSQRLNKKESQEEKGPERGVQPD